MMVFHEKKKKKERKNRSINSRGRLNGEGWGVEKRGEGEEEILRWYGKTMGGRPKWVASKFTFLAGKMESWA